MDIREAKQQVKDTVEAYLACDDAGMPRITSAEQRPIFLLGAPGIGKTAIVSQVADELDIGLVAYSMTHHTRQSALGLPFIVHKTYRSGAEFDISEYTMSEIIASIYDYMEESGHDTGILFLDEINCVSETLYPSMLQFLQFKTFGRHRVPEGWIVVCAGNPPEYNRNVHEFDIVTMDRLRRVDIEPSFEAWRVFSRERAVHPAITTYLEVRPDDFYLVESTPEGKSFVSARSWSELSELMALLEDLGKSVDSLVIGQYVQHPEIAARFASYYELFTKYRSDYQVEAILAGEAPEGIVERARDAAFDERLALMALLLESLGTAMRPLPEREQALGRTRDALRAVRNRFSNLDDAAEDAPSFAEAFEEARQGLAGKTRPVRGTSIRSQEAARVDARTQAFMRELAVLPSYDAAADAYRTHVTMLEADVAGASRQIDNAYAFIGEAFGEGSEMLVFTTELTARRDTALFIARHGNETYAAKSAVLSTASHRDAIFDEIDALTQ